ncbi:hypothetical protein M3221_18400 [Domibacillus indicus]|uniref:hypothetical protein n=1 Tax=Domibacillus indicus TaxID=1437523 RepID=UPI0020405AF7|nr:hypothetical protein [Domibacillus indicus]MCM3790350.1 hypothetical protein [Domibacillus indicus]
MITTAFTDGNTLICAMSSERKSGLYFIAVRPEKGCLIVTHSVSGSPENQALYVEEAVACYHVWQWWDPRTKVIVKTAPITLKPEWVQIPVPGTVQDIIQQIGEEEWHAAEYFGYCR